MSIMIKYQISQCITYKKKNMNGKEININNYEINENKYAITIKHTMTFLLEFSLLLFSNV